MCCSKTKGMWMPVIFNSSDKKKRRFWESQGLVAIKDDGRFVTYEDPARIKNKGGRPRKHNELGENKTHRMTPTAHAWIKENRDLVERLARMDYEIQFKALVK